MAGTGRRLLPRGALLGPALVAMVLSGAGARAQALEPAQAYVARGKAVLTLDGPRCCGLTRFTGEFELAYQVDSAGQAMLTRLDAEMDDSDVVVDVFLGLWTERMRLRCTSAGAQAVATGWSDGAGHLVFPASALRLTATAHGERYADDSCGGDEYALEAANNAPMNVSVDPAANTLGFDATFYTSLEGEPYALTFHGTGHFVNRPPVARLGLVTAASPQGGCPAYWRWNGPAQAWELVAEANTPAGLKALLRSSSTDPDGAWPSGDVLAERWFAARDGGPAAPLGDGRQIGPLTLEFGPVHRIELVAGDYAGATSASACQFRVIDTIPPVVVPPAPITVGCTQPGGATPAGSPALQAFLGAATASDLVTAAPVALTPLTAGTEVAGMTLFPLDGATHPVTFRFRDAAGNVSSADSAVSVMDEEPPSLTVDLTPGALPADGKLWVVAATLTGSDECGGALRFSLVSIKSNAPAYDAADVLDAGYGSDDRSVVLRARLAAPGVARVYKITYRTVDAAGHATYVTATVTVAA